MVVLTTCRLSIGLLHLHRLGPSICIGWAPPSASSSHPALLHLCGSSKTKAVGRFLSQTLPQSLRLMSLFLPRAWSLLLQRICSTP